MGVGVGGWGFGGVGGGGGEWVGGQVFLWWTPLAHVLPYRWSMYESTWIQGRVT